MSNLKKNKPLMILSIVAIAYMGLCFVFYLLQGHLLFHPQKRSVTDPENTMILKSGDADIVITKSIKPGNKAIMYFGGNAEDVSLNLASFDRRFPKYSLYLMHYRGYGGSDGTPNEKDIYADAIRLYDEVSKDKKEISIIGRSIGTVFAVHLASERQTSGLILITPYDSIENVAKHHYPIFPVSLLIKDKFESYLYAKNVSSPTTILMAGNDTVIPAKSTKRLHESFNNGISNLVVIDGVGHNSISSSKQYFNAIQNGLVKK